MRTLRRVVLGLLLLIAAAVGYAALFFDPEGYKPEILAAVEKATGRKMEIKGRIRLALSVRPTIELSEVTLFNPPGFSRQEMASIGKIELRLALMPLIGKRIEIERLVLSKPDVRLETDAKGHGNWVFIPTSAKVPISPEPAGAAAPPSGPSAPMAVAIRELRLDDGIFAFRDGKTGHVDTLAVKQITVQTASAEAPLRLNAALVMNDTEIGIVAETGNIGHLTGAIKGEWPLKLAVTVGGATINLEGGIAEPMGRQAVDLGLTANIPDLAALAVHLRRDLPAIKALVVSGRLTGDINKFSIRDLKMTSSVGDLAGDVTVVAGLPIGLTANLKSDRFDVDALAVPRPAAPAPAPAPAPANAAPPPAIPPAIPPAAPAEAKPKWLIPDKKLSVGELQLMNVDVQLSMGTLRLGGSDYTALQAHAVLKDGALKLDPASANLPQGHVALTLTTDAGVTVPPVHLTVRAPAIALAPLLASIGQPPFASGNLDIVADLRGAGESPHAIASSLDGMLTMVVPGGTIDLKRIGGSVARVLQVLPPMKAAGSASALRCLVLRVDFAHGLGTVRPLTLGSGLLNMDGEGTVNLADETLALLLRSRATIAGAAVSVPVSVTGSLAAPQTKVNELGLAQGNAALFGGLLGGQAGGVLGGGQRPASGDSCPAALALVRGQAAPAAPAAPPAAAPQPARPNNPGQMLKQLFR